MGNNLFGARIAERVAAALGPRLLPMTLIKRTGTTRNVANPTGPAQIQETRFSCRGIIDTYDSNRFGATAIGDGEPVALILAATLPSSVRIEPDDRIEVGGGPRSGDVHEVVGPVQSDPDLATFLAQLKS